MNRTHFHPATRLLVIAAFLLISGCDYSFSGPADNRILIGNNFELSGTLADVGEQARFAAEMFVEGVNESGGVELDGETYTLEVVYADNEGTADGATDAAHRLIASENALAMVGPNPSNAAIAAGEVANDLETLMISPWSTNPNTTLDRPWVFRVPFLDTFQGPVLANFATSQFAATSACVLFDEANDYPRGLAESFRDAWEALHGAGSIAAYEAFTTGDVDYSEQLTTIRDAGCDFLFAPQYSHEVPLIVTQAQDLGITMPILGADAWGGPELLEQCGDACEGYFFSAHYVPAGATGATKAFIDDFADRYGSIPTDVAALTWDAMLLIEQALQNCGSIGGHLASDRACLRDGMAAIEAFDGITGTMTFDEQGDPIKCATMVRIENGTFTAYESACP